MVVIRCGKVETSEQECEINLNYKANKDDEFDFDDFDYRNYHNFVVQITPIGRYNEYFVSEVKGGKFKIRSTFDGEFYWTVFCEPILFNTGLEK